MARKNVEFSKLGRYLEAEVKSASAAEYKAFAFDVFGEVLQKTPVDTGRARANWHISTTSPDYGEVAANSPTEIPNIQVEEFPSVFISNGLDYIEALEDGRSDQAPNGISGPALAAVRARR